MKNIIKKKKLKQFDSILNYIVGVDMWQHHIHTIDPIDRSTDR